MTSIKFSAYVSQLMRKIHVSYLFLLLVTATGCLHAGSGFRRNLKPLSEQDWAFYNTILDDQTDPVPLREEYAQRFLQKLSGSLRRDFNSVEYENTVWLRGNDLTLGFYRLNKDQSRYIRVGYSRCGRFFEYGGGRRNPWESGLGAKSPVSVLCPLHTVSGAP